MYPIFYLLQGDWTAPLRVEGLGFGASGILPARRWGFYGLGFRYVCVGSRYAWGLGFRVMV